MSAIFSDRLIMWGWVIVSFMLLLALPSSYSQIYNIECMIVSIMAFWGMCGNKLLQYRSLCSFSVIFVFVLIISNYLYGTYFYLNDPEWSIFILNFDATCINKGSCMTTIACTSFCLAQIQGERIVYNKKSKRSLFPYEALKIGKVEILVVGLLILLYIINTWGSVLASSDDHSGQFRLSFTNYLRVAFIYLYYLIVKDFYLCRHRANSLREFFRHCNKQVLFLSIVSVVFYVLTGGRTTPMRIILLYVFLFHFFIKRISAIQILLMGTIGIVAMFLVGTLREIWGYDELSWTMVSKALNVSNILYYTRDLVINSRSLYELISYADNIGLTLGTTFILDISAVIPGLQSFIVRALGISQSQTNSAFLVTELYFQGEKATLGLGTNIVGDVYVSFWIVGVFIMFWGLGRVVRYLENMSYKGNLLHCMFFCILSADVVFYTRSGFFSPLRNILWLWFFYSIEIRSTRKSIRSNIHLYHQNTYRINETL